MYHDYLVVSDPVGTLKSRDERVLFQRVLEDNLPSRALREALDTYVDEFVTIAESMDRIVIEDRDSPHRKWLRRLEVRNQEHDLVAVRDVQIMTLDSDEEC